MPALPLVWVPPAVGLPGIRLVATGGGPNPTPPSVSPASPITSTDPPMSKCHGSLPGWPGPLLTAGNNAGANDQLYSFHPGGVNCSVW